jgi:hypothetical protein
MIPRSVYIAIAIVLALFGIYRWGFHKGWNERDVEMQAQIAIKNEESRAIEQKLTAQVNENAKNLHEANNAIDEKQSALDRAIRAGRMRFPTSSCVQATTDTTVATGNRDEESSGSDGEVLAAIAAIIAEGQRNTEQLNACITAYDQVRESINASNR